MKLTTTGTVFLSFLLSQAASTAATPAKTALAATSHSQLASDKTSEEPSLPRYKEFVDGSRSLLRAEAKATSISDQIQLTLAIVQMSKRLEADPRYATSPTLQQTRRKLHARLRTIKQKTVNAERRNKNRPAKIEIKRDVLGQLNQALNGVRANGNNRPNNRPNNNLFPADYGPMLVDLIQRTISPSSWDVNGGASTIQYWRPGTALVVRAPQSVHEETAPVLRQLRVQ